MSTKPQKVSVFEKQLDSRNGGKIQKVTKPYKVKLTFGGADILRKRKKAAGKHKKLQEGKRGGEKPSPTKCKLGDTDSPEQILDWRQEAPDDAKNKRRLRVVNAHTSTTKEALNMVKRKEVVEKSGGGGKALNKLSNKENWKGGLRKHEKQIVRSVKREGKKAELVEFK